MMNNDNNEMKGISILVNSFKYFLEHAFIISYEGSYRLLVIHRWRLMTDRCYKTLKGARIAFLKLYSERRWKDQDEPEWSSFYNPGIEHFNPQTSKIESWNQTRTYSNDYMEQAR